MHNYLKSIGFRDIDQEDLKILLTDVKAHPDYQNMTDDSGDVRMIEYRKEYAYNQGINISGSLDEIDGFVMDYYYPYLIGELVSSQEDVEIVMNSDREAYQGIIDDPKMGIDLVFYITDDLCHVRSDYQSGQFINHGGVRLSGLCEKGSVLLPLDESIRPVEDLETVTQRANLMKAAKSGDHEAIETLSIQDIDQYNEIGERISKEDIFTILSSYIMPKGIESDKYTILGDITECKKFMNEITHQMVYRMLIRVNSMMMTICINEKDLLGEPIVGRRFYGDLWLQGRIF